MKHSSINRLNKSQPWEIEVADVRLAQQVLPPGQHVQFVFPGCESKVDKFLLSLLARDVTNF